MDIPYGYCYCGCGGKTVISKRTDTAAGICKGKPKKFIANHGRSITTPKGQDHHRWKGGRKINNGYVLIKSPDHPRADFHGYIPEHILAMEESLGYRIPLGAEVHHRNGVRSDNTISNLILCKDHHEHMSLHQNEKALEECGNPDYRMCSYCRMWDSVNNMVYIESQRQFKHPNHKRKFRNLTAQHKQNISKSHLTRFERRKNEQHDIRN